MDTWGRSDTATHNTHHPLSDLVRSSELARTLTNVQTMPSKRRADGGAEGEAENATEATVTDGDTQVLAVDDATLKLAKTKIAKVGSRSGCFHVAFCGLPPFILQLWPAKIRRGHMSPAALAFRLHAANGMLLFLLQRHCVKKANCCQRTPPRLSHLGSLSILCVSYCDPQHCVASTSHQSVRIFIVILLTEHIHNNITHIDSTRHTAPGQGERKEERRWCAERGVDGAFVL